MPKNLRTLKTNFESADGLGTNVDFKVQTFQDHAILFLTTFLLVPDIEIFVNSILS